MGLPPPCGNKHRLTKPPPTLCLYFPGHLESPLPSHPHEAYLGQDTCTTIWGTGPLCPWPDVLGERSVASALQALENMGHCHPHRARPGQEGCVEVPSGGQISLCQCLQNHHTLPLQPQARTGHQARSWSSRDSVRDGTGPPGEESMGLCFALIEHLKKFYIRI